MLLGDMKINVIQPVKTHGWVLRQTKSKVGKRRIRVKVFSGLVEVLKDNQIIEHRPSNSYHMNQATYDALRKEMIHRKTDKPGDFLSQQMRPYY